MFINYKMALLNYTTMITFILMITLFQNVWSGLFGFDIPVYLWIPCIIYWSLYRKTGETVFIVYFITLNIASTSSLFAGYLLFFNSLILLTILLLKRVYYTSLAFFSHTTALTLLFYPTGLWTLSQIMEGKSYLHGILPMLTGALLTWILSFPLLRLFQTVDSFTIIKTEGQKQPMKL